MNNSAERCKTRIRCKVTKEFVKQAPIAKLSCADGFASGFNVGFEQGYKRAMREVASYRGGVHGRS